MAFIQQTFPSCSRRDSSLACCRVVLTDFSRAFWCSCFCCSRAASMWICSLTLCSASSVFNWSMRRCAWAISAFKSSTDSLPAQKQTKKYIHTCFLKEVLFLTKDSTLCIFYHPLSTIELKYF